VPSNQTIFWVCRTCLAISTSNKLRQPGNGNPACRNGRKCDWITFSEARSLPSKNKQAVSEIEDYVKKEKDNKRKIPWWVTEGYKSGLINEGKGRTK